MKLLFPLLLFATALTAQEASPGIDFVEKPFADLLAQATAEDKLIFLDAYTTWCGPCKMMSAKVFPDEQVGQVFNERFINAKIDMEKGEGPALARRYVVSAYPTYLFINGEGELVHRGIGYIPKPALLRLADVAVSDRSTGALGARYEAGERDPAFLKTYAEALASSNEGARADAVVSDYLDTQSDWSTPENLGLIISSPGELGDKRMLYLIENATDIESELGSGSVANTVQRTIINNYHIANRKRSLVSPEEIAPFYALHAGKLEDRLLGQYALIYYERQNDMAAYLPAAIDHYSAYPSQDYSELNSLAWTFYEHAEDPEQLRQAIEWAKQSVDLRRYYPNLDTLAWLYHKTGQQQKAEATAKQAIEIAKAEELDYSATEKIFE